MQKLKYIILGGGMVAGYAAKELASQGLKSGELAIFSADTALPYERPPLSKGYLAGKDERDSVFINNTSFYEDHGIALSLNTNVERVELERRHRHVRDGEPIEYEKLLIATGA